MSGAAGQSSSSSGLGTEEDVDLEVEAVLSKGIQSDIHTASPTKRYSSITPGKHNYSPFRLSTVMTNVSRGNTRTCTPSVHNMTIQQLAAQGELLLLQEEIQEQFINDVDEHGLTILAWAAANDQLLSVEYLMRLGADPNVCGEEGSTATPMMLAASNGHDRVLRCFLESGCDVNLESQDGHSALHYATFNQHPECVKLLLEYGADFTVESNNGKTPFDIAVTKGFKDVQQVLERHMVKLLESG